MTCQTSNDVFETAGACVSAYVMSEVGAPLSGVAPWQLWHFACKTEATSHGSAAPPPPVVPPLPVATAPPLAAGPPPLAARIPPVPAGPPVPPCGGAFMP